MKHILLFLSLTLLFGCKSSEPRVAALMYEPDNEYPFGRPNPDAPAELAQFHFMIGRNNCEEQRLNNSSGEWDPGIRTWDAHYYMNGYTIRDSGRSGSGTNGNIRAFDVAEKQWNVTFLSMPTYSSGIWKGRMEGENLVLRQAQKAPGTAIDGFSRLTFSNISDKGFDWDGEWISEDGSIVFPFWRIQCLKAEAPG